jgi:hypothetical protein
MLFANANGAPRRGLSSHNYTLRVLAELRVTNYFDDCYA